LPRPSCPYYFPTESEPGVAIVARTGTRLLSGVFIINDPGGGVKSLARFRARSFAVAKAFGMAEVEFFGAEVRNTKLANIVLSHGFRRKEIVCPEELGDEGNVIVLARRFTL
jgi:hypothetical protein